MLEINELTYTALITFTHPDTGEQTQATIQLQPADTLEMADGEVKRWQDCTQTDLPAYADTLEKDVWQTYEAIELGELVNANELNIVMTLVREDDGEQPETADILNHILVHAESAPVAEAASEETAVEDIPVVDKTNADDDGITVSETEPVFEEKEAPPVDENAVTPPPMATSELRIMGKRRPNGHPTSAAVDILINEPAFRNAQAHSLTSLNKEVAGMLIGPQPEKQPDGRYVVHITDIIIAKHTKMQGASVTYTPESWRYVNDTLRERYPNDEAVIVGWYHTHPGFGIFLSGMDLFIHQNFFTQTWHIAYVLDPVSKRSGFFCWDRGKTRVDRYEFPWPNWAGRSW